MERLFNRYYKLHGKEVSEGLTGEEAFEMEDIIEELEFNGVTF